jgi:L-iditol 2-dehydrogenase
MTLGHESAGVVVAVGDSPKNSFQIGDKVALEVGLPCEKCDLCQTGRYNICENMHFMSSARRMPHDNGTLKQRVNHPAKYCHK